MVKMHQPGKRVFDANVLLELIHGRTKAGAARKAISSMSQEHNAVSALTYHLVCAFGVKSMELDSIRDFLAGFEVIDLAGSDFDTARSILRNSDFEDAVQLVCAAKYGANEFVTFDKNLARDYADFDEVKVVLLA